LLFSYILAIVRQHVLDLHIHGCRSFRWQWEIWSDSDLAKFPQSLSKQESAVHVNTMCGPPSKLLCQLGYSWRR